MNTATNAGSLYCTANMNEQTERAQVWPECCTVSLGQKGMKEMAQSIP